MDSTAFAAVLFDLDGTLVDSERETAEAMARALARHQGVTITQDDRDFIIGRSWVAIHARLAAAYPAMQWTLAELAAAAADAREDVLAEVGVTVLPGARAIARLGAVRALVTGSSRREARQMLDLLGLTDAFPVVVAAEDVARSKPEPDGYLAAARALAVDPARCLVIEDSAAGIAAGRAAGCTVVGVRAGNFHGQDQSAAHLVIDTLEHLDDAALGRLAAGSYGVGMRGPR
jgi:HAD superfamily hydrolase (TIGR01509 family)